MSSLDLKQIAGALGGFWAGGSGPTRAQVESAMLIAGCEDLAGGNKQEYVQGAITDADDEAARLIIEELLSLLRESGEFEYPSSEQVSRLLRVVERTAHSLTADGFITWQNTGQVNVALQATPVAPVAAAPILPSFAPPTVQTHEMSRLPTEVSSPDTRLLVSCLRRLGAGAARPLVERRRADRPGIKVTDEYDVQDLAESMLRSLYNDVRSEEPTPSSAGSSSRVDLHLREGGTAVEIKVTRPGRGEKKIKKEVLVDINDYKGHPHVRTLIVAIYDLAGTFNNRDGFEHDLSDASGDLSVHVLVVPWVGPK